MKRTVAVGVLVLTAVLGPRAAGQDVAPRRTLPDLSVGTVGLIGSPQGQGPLLAASTLVLERVPPRRRLREPNQKETERKVGGADQRAIEFLGLDAKEIEIEIEKAKNDLVALQARSAQLELRLKKLTDELAQEVKRLQARTEESALREREEKAREKALESLKALDKTIVRFGEDPGRGMEEKLDTILKRLESVEKRLSNLEGKRQPNRPKK